MINFLLGITAILLFFSCNEANQSNDKSSKEDSLLYNRTFQTYELRGNIRGLESDSILLIKFTDNNPEPQFIRVIDGKFRYRDSLQAPFFVHLNYFEKIQTINTGKQIQKSFIGTAKLTEFIVEPGITYIEGSAPKYDSVKVWGGHSDSIVKSYLKEDQVLDKKWATLKITYENFVKRGHKLEAKEIAAKMNNINKNERISLLKNYVQLNAGNTAGALLPNFCTLQHFLTKADYLEMYNYLSKEMKLTTYGQSVLANSK